MRDLIIHPKDSTTQFLSQIYAPIRNKTVITGGVCKSELWNLIETHDRIIMLGHGTPYGLLSIDQFPNFGSYIVDDSMFGILKRKTENIFIWCDADIFVKCNYLDGLCCGMFLSYEEESILYVLEDIDRKLIDESNYGFSSILGKYINEPMAILYRNLVYKYGILARTNTIARFNLERFRLEINEFKSYDQSELNLIRGLSF
jgi:hypothetical protein